MDKKQPVAKHVNPANNYKPESKISSSIPNNYKPKSNDHPSKISTMNNSNKINVSEKIAEMRKIINNKSNLNAKKFSNSIQTSKILGTNDSSTIQVNQATKENLKIKTFKKANILNENEGNTSTKHDPIVSEGLLVNSENIKLKILNFKQKINLNAEHTKVSERDFNVLKQNIFKEGLDDCKYSELTNINHIKIEPSTDQEHKLANSRHEKGPICEYKDKKENEILLLSGQILKVADIQGNIKVNDNKENEIIENNIMHIEDSETLKMTLLNNRTDENEIKIECLVEFGLGMIRNRDETNLIKSSLMGKNSLISPVKPSEFFSGVSILSSPKVEPQQEYYEQENPLKLHVNANQNKTGSLNRINLNTMTESNSLKEKEKLNKKVLKSSNDQIPFKIKNENEECFRNDDININNFSNDSMSIDEARENLDFTNDKLLIVKVESDNEDGFIDPTKVDYTKDSKTRNNNNKLLGKLGCKYAQTFSDKDSRKKKVLDKYSMLIRKLNTIYDYLNNNGIALILCIEFVNEFLEKIPSINYDKLIPVAENEEDEAIFDLAKFWMIYIEAIVYTFKMKEKKISFNDVISIFDKIFSYEIDLPNDLKSFYLSVLNNNFEKSELKARLLKKEEEHRDSNAIPKNYQYTLEEDLHVFLKNNQYVFNPERLITYIVKQTASKNKSQSIVNSNISSYVKIPKLESNFKNRGKTVENPIPQHERERCKQEIKKFEALEEYQGEENIPLQDTHSQIDNFKDNTNKKASLIDPIKAINDDVLSKKSFINNQTPKNNTSTKVILTAKKNIPTLNNVSKNVNNIHNKNIDTSSYNSILQLGVNGKLQNKFLSERKFLQSENKNNLKNNTNKTNSQVNSQNNDKNLTISDLKFPFSDKKFKICDNNASMPNKTTINANSNDSYFATSITNQHNNLLENSNMARKFLENNFNQEAADKRDETFDNKSQIEISETNIKKEEIFSDNKINSKISSENNSKKDESIKNHYQYNNFSSSHEKIIKQESLEKPNFIPFKDREFYEELPPIERQESNEKATISNKLDTENVNVYAELTFVGNEQLNDNIMDIVESTTEKPKNISIQENCFDKGEDIKEISKNESKANDFYSMYLDFFTRNNIMDQKVNTFSMNIRPSPPLSKHTVKDISFVSSQNSIYHQAKPDIKPKSTENLSQMQTASYSIMQAENEWSINPKNDKSNLMDIINAEDKSESNNREKNVVGQILEVKKDVSAESGIIFNNKFFENENIKEEIEQVEPAKHQEKPKKNDKSKPNKRSLSAVSSNRQSNSNNIQEKKSHPRQRKFDNRETSNSNSMEKSNYGKSKNRETKERSRNNIQVINDKDFSNDENEKNAKFKNEKIKNQKNFNAKKKDFQSDTKGKLSKNVVNEKGKESISQSSYSQSSSSSKNKKAKNKKAKVPSRNKNQKNKTIKVESNSDEDMTEDNKKKNDSFTTETDKEESYNKDKDYKTSEYHKNKKNSKNNKKRQNSGKKTIKKQDKHDGFFSNSEDNNPGNNIAPIKQKKNASNHNANNKITTNEMDEIEKEIDKKLSKIKNNKQLKSTNRLNNKSSVISPSPTSKSINVKKNKNSDKSSKSRSQSTKKIIKKTKKTNKEKSRINSEREKSFDDSIQEIEAGYSLRSRNKNDVKSTSRVNKKK